MKDKKVFFADDSKTMREQVSGFLNDMGISHLTYAENGKQAVDLLKKETQEQKVFDLILLDINMPGFNGIQVLKILRTIKIYEHTPVLMVSSENEKKTVLDSILSGATDYILKPFDYKTFQVKILKYLN